METLNSYLEKINVEIRNHMACEVEHGVDRQGEHDLYILFKNRKYALEMLAEHTSAGSTK